VLPPSPEEALDVTPARPETLDPVRQPERSPGTARSARRGFRPEIQGLRAVALGLVVAYHVWLGRVSGGVDVFLLVSAFLMTGQFLDRHRRGVRVGLVKRWIHTFRRLLPPAVVTIIGTVVAVIAFLPPTRLGPVLEQAWASLGYVENFVLQRDAVDYYAGDHALASPFQHFWSLSIQGQVFIVFPVIFVAVSALCRARSLDYWGVLLKVFGAVFVLSLAYSVYFTAVSQSEAYFDTFARLWEFALGALVALVAQRVDLPARVAAIAGWVGLAGIVTCGLILRVDGMFPGAAALWPTLSASAVILAADSGGRAGVHRLLDTPPLRKLGDISYSLYLWHWPVLVIALAVTGKERMGWLSGSVAIAGSLVLAYLTTRFIDRPWRAWAWPEKNRRRGLLSLAACGAAVAVLVGSVQISLDAANHRALANASRDNPGAAVLVPGYNGHPDPKAELLPAADQLPSDWAGLPDPCDDDLGLSDTLRDHGCTQIGASGASKTVLVVGNSHAQQWLGALAPIAQQRNWRLYQLLKGGCQFQPPRGDDADECDQFNGAVLQQIADHKPDAVVLVGTAAAPSSPKETTTPGLEDLVKTFESEDVDVIALRDNPRFTFNMADCVTGSDPESCRVPVSQALAAEDPLAPLAKTYPKTLHPIDMTDMLCPQGQCEGVIGNVYVYLDDNHVSATYSASMSSILDQRISRATGWT
jgi:peptidoglycan/LPS O-acetylase OafA/YrhL